MVDVIKQLAMDAIGSTSFADICVGVVTSASPLQIQLEEGMVLEERFLILSKNVTEHEETGTLYSQTTNGYAIQNAYLMVRSLALTTGEQVILMKANGGQTYVVLDRVGGV
ncbi:DUF2577 domain-containing protein [Chakrabartyella piscis]|uniref:DUF2577 domain-containing protein n=1 Tax=Chakrabartyella piscis TaxID=2918914 RepID=UPI002958A3A4|nr:DUF2577 domain-containing protein [Chakrabartyella piscis]